MALPLPGGLRTGLRAGIWDAAGPGVYEEMGGRRVLERGKKTCKLVSGDFLDCVAKYSCVVSGSNSLRLFIIILLFLLFFLFMHGLSWLAHHRCNLQPVPRKKAV